MRLFIAIPLSAEMKAALKQTQDYLSRRGVRGNYSPEENFHITLAFIGEYPEPDDVLDVLSSVPFQSTEIRLSGFGSFGDLLWAGIEKNNALESYVKRLRRALPEADIPFDRKRFSPHITLIRRATGKIPGVTSPPVQMNADHATLFRSDRGKNGMIYTEL